MPFELVATFGLTTTGRSLRSTLIGSLRPDGAHPPRRTVRSGTSSSVTEPRQLHELSTVWVGAGHLAGAKAAIVLVLSEPEAERYRAMDQYDLGQATMAMMLAATDLGIGSGHSAVGDQEACRRIIAVPPDHTCAYMIGFGYPADRPLRPIVKPDRRPFDEVVHRGHW